VWRSNRIERSAFERCLCLHSVDLPASLEILGKDCFPYCGTLGELTFEPGSRLRQIHPGAFSYCSCIYWVAFPDSVKLFDGLAFDGEDNMRIEFSGSNPHLRVCENFIIDDERKALIQLFGYVSHEIVAPEIRVIGSGCFRGKYWLLTVTFEYGSQLTRIEHRAFAGCHYLSTICIPASVREIVGSAFEGCELSTKGITFEDGSSSFAVSGDFLVKTGTISAIRYFGAETSVTVTRDIRILSPGCFSSFSTIFSVAFEAGSKLMRIESYAFESCTRLQSICVPASVTTLCMKCFARCTSLWELTCSCSSCEVQSSVPPGPLQTH
jgi:hypothetical protein